MIDRLQSLILPIISFTFSAFAFLFTLKNEFQKSFRLKMDIMDTCLKEWNVDRTKDEIPDIYHQDKFRLFPYLVITNESSLPITVTKFSINNSVNFGMFTQNGTVYQVTLETLTKKNGKGFYSYGGNETFIKIDLREEDLLKPPFTIKPFESVCGIAFFHYDESLIGTNSIVINTSRGTKKYEIQVEKQLVSQLLTDYSPPQLDGPFWEDDLLD